MHLSELKLWNFRKYGIKGESFENSEPGLSVSFNEGVNVLVGENDSGKTAIIDAIRYILKTQSLEFIPIEEKDFFKGKGKRADQLKIECVFSGFNDNEAANYLEWIGFDNNGNYQLNIWLYAKRKDNAVRPVVRAGPDDEGSYIEGDARDLIRITYLKPLRDALNELTAGRNSRLSQIFKSHQVFKVKDKKEPHPLERIFESADNEVKTYFNTGQGSDILSIINDGFLKKFLLDGDTRTSGIIISENELSEILKKLSLLLEENKSGLGSLNLLFMAAELLHLKRDSTGLKLTLIEELEAHLHPQYQLRLIDFIQNNKEYGQFILTTHSTTLASKIDLENLIICQGDKIFPMGHEYTQLEEGDYTFLKRFLDATKANLFFARGVILVEGDAENLLLPTIAEIIERPLHNFGVSIVNIGNTAFKRYSRIFLREPQKGRELAADDYFDIPVAIVTDLDVAYDIEKNQEILQKERVQKKSTIEGKFNAQKVKVFVPPKWTLEYDLALSCLKNHLYQAIIIAKKIKANNELVITEDLISQAKIDSETYFASKTDISAEELAFEIYELIRRSNLSKAVVAQCLAMLLVKDKDQIRYEIKHDSCLKYLRDAIEYVTKPLIQVTDEA
jgi:putative ATP-dependent endonuclease of the OLD family